LLDCDLPWRPGTANRRWYFGRLGGWRHTARRKAVEAPPEVAEFSRQKIPGSTLSLRSRTRLKSHYGRKLKNWFNVGSGIEA